MPNAGQIASVLSKIVTAVGTILTITNVVPEAQWKALQESFNGAIGPISAVIGAAMVVGSTLFGVYKQSRQQKIQSCADIPSVQKVVTDPTTANSPTFKANDKVVSSST